MQGGPLLERSHTTSLTERLMGSAGEVTPRSRIGVHGSLWALLHQSGCYEGLGSLHTGT